MFGEGFAACLLGAFGWRRTTPVEPPTAVIGRTRRVRRVLDGTSFGLPHDQSPALAAEPTPTRHQIDATPAPGRYEVFDLPPREMARRHANHVVAHLLRVSDFVPGAAIPSGEMYLVYEMLCEREGWRERPWNPVAAEINKLIGKKYHRRQCYDGQERQTRVYIVPPLDHPLRQPTKSPKGRRGSKAKRLQADTAPIPDRLRRAA